MAEGQHTDVLEEVLRSHAELEGRLRRIEGDNVKLRLVMRATAAMILEALSSDDEPELTERVQLRTVEGGSP